MKAINYLLLLIAITFICILHQPLHAQGLKGQGLADSLINELPKTKSDTDKVKLLKRVAGVLTLINSDEALSYANKCMSLSRKINWTKGIGLSYQAFSQAYYEKAKYDSTLQYAINAYETYKTIPDKEAMANALINIANAYDATGYYAKAIENLFTALRLYEGTGNKKGMARVHNVLGVSYFRTRDYPKAIDNYSKGLDLFTTLNDKSGIASSLDNIAGAYMEQGKYDSANIYNEQATKLFEEISTPSELAKVYYNRGNLLQAKNDFKTAYEFYIRALDIDKKLDTKKNMAFAIGSIGELYFELAKNPSSNYTIPPAFKTTKTSLLQNARKYFTEALELSKKINDLALIMRYTESLSGVEERSGNNKAALALYKESMLYKDSIFNDENKRKIAALENQRLAAVKDKEIQLLNKDKALQASEIKRQTLTKNIIIIAVLVAAIFTFFFIRSFIRRRKITFDKQVLQTEMKALRAQMNPHFIFNSLHSINKYVIENDSRTASEYLAKFAKLMRLVLENSREQEVPIEDDIAALELYMQLESLRFEKGFKYSIEIDPNIDRENTLIPPLMLQPFAENAIVHGISDKEDGLIKINIHAENNNMIKCVVEDNGGGGATLQSMEMRNDKKRKSLGMRITQERLNIINQLRKAKAAVHIFDLKDAENKSGGSRIELLLPLQLAV